LEFKHRFRRYFFLVTTREKIVGQMMFFLCERSFLAEDIFRAVE
jgi:hypothetical protein